MNEQLRQAAVDWFNDCEWAEDFTENMDFDSLTDSEITRALNRHYSGKFEQFKIENE